MTISKQLKEAIQKSDQTFYRIAKDAGVNWSALQRFITGERPNIRIDTVDRLCEYFGLELQPKQAADKQPANKRRTTAKKKAGK
jgi:DNA-binding Xre family transcriptional regulator